MTQPASGEAVNSTPAQTSPNVSPGPDATIAPSPEGFTLFTVLRKDPANPDDLDGHDVPRAVDELDDVVALVEDEGITVRGFYDVSGLSSDADVLIWMHAADAETLQWASRELHRSRLLKSLLPTWSALGVHHADGQSSHAPAFLQGAEPKSWLAVCPIQHAAEWYLLPASERESLLAEQDRVADTFPGVAADTVSAHGLGDYDVLMPIESDELTELVDLVRALRATDARRHVHAEGPSYTGRRVTIAELVEVMQ